MAQGAPALLSRLGLPKSQDDIPADPADSLKEDEKDRKTNHAPLVAVTENEVVTLTATIETNFRQGDIGVEVDGMKGDLTETENHFSGDQASSEYEEERQKSRADELRDISTVGGEVSVAVRQLGWTCPQPLGNAVVFLLDSLMSSLIVTLRHRNPNGTCRPSWDRFVVGKNDVTVWDPGLSDPAFLPW